MIIHEKHKMQIKPETYNCGWLTEFATTVMTAVLKKFLYLSVEQIETIGKICLFSIRKY